MKTQDRSQKDTLFSFRGLSGPFIYYHSTQVGHGKGIFRIIGQITKVHEANLIKNRILIIRITVLFHLRKIN